MFFCHHTLPLLAASGSVNTSVYEIVENADSIEIKELHKVPYSSICTALSNDGNMLAICGADKKLHIYRLGNEPKLVWSRTMPKKLVKIVFDSKDETIVVCDRFGDIYRFDAVRSLPEYEGKIDDDEFGAELLCGHVSMTTDILRTSGSDGREYLISSDRDEKIRVTCYPDTFNIHTFLLEHTEYVASVCKPNGHDNILLTAGGDGFVIVWDFVGGAVKQKLEIPCEVDILDVLNVIQLSQTNFALILQKPENILFFNYKPSEGTFDWIQDRGVNLEATPIEASFNQRQSLMWVLYDDRSTTCFKISDDMAITPMNVPEPLTSPVDSLQDAVIMRETLRKDRMALQEFQANKKWQEKIERRNRNKKAKVSA